MVNVGGSNRRIYLFFICAEFFASKVIFNILGGTVKVRYNMN